MIYFLESLAYAEVVAKVCIAVSDVEAKIEGVFVGNPKSDAEASAG